MKPAKYGQHDRLLHLIVKNKLNTEQYSLFDF
jgi:hypothetical protein